MDLCGNRYELKQVPAGFVNPTTRLLLAPWSLINAKIFLEEVELCGLDPSRVGVDENAGVIEEADISKGSELDLRGRLGPTGAAVSRRVLQEGDSPQAKGHPDLVQFTTFVRCELTDVIRRDRIIVVESTQGFGF